MLRPRPFPTTRPSLLATLGSDPPGQAAWREFFERYAPAVFRVARMRSLDEADADDIVQQVMVSVSTHMDGFRYDRDRGRFRKWVRQIAERKIIDLRRRRQARSFDATAIHSTEVLESQPDDRPSIQDQWEQEWRLQDMLWCLDQVAADISPRRIEAFRMYVLEGRSASDVARQMNMTEGYVYVTRYHLLGLIRTRLELLEAEEGP